LILALKLIASKRFFFAKDHIQIVPIGPFKGLGIFYSPPFSPFTPFAFVQFRHYGGEKRANHQTIFISNDFTCFPFCLSMYCISDF
jgi:hypothetical protein